MTTSIAPVTKGAAVDPSSLPMVDARARLAGWLEVHDVRELGHQLKRDGQRIEGKRTEVPRPTRAYLATADETATIRGLSSRPPIRDITRRDYSSLITLPDPRFADHDICRNMVPGPRAVITTDVPPSAILGLEPPVQQQARCAFSLGMYRLGARRRKAVEPR